MYLSLIPLCVYISSGSLLDLIWVEQTSWSISHSKFGGLLTLLKEAKHTYILPIVKFANNSVHFKNLDICILTTVSITKNVHSIFSVLSLFL